ncbi:MAG TPA: 2OG-Fe dioxygenase family protein [Halothiobacillus sp.]|nr:2OG-Fe dioxygenase family protein [Halothiobacillus sp.]
MPEINAMPAGWETLSFGAPLPPGLDKQSRLRNQGFCLLSADELYKLTAIDPASCAAAVPLWNDLPADNYLKDGGHYRSRRHGSFVQTLSPKSDSSELVLASYRPHWQPTSYNALHGGMLRHFEPLIPELLALSFWTPLLTGLGQLFAEIKPTPQWFIEAHQFRIDTQGGVGRPTPEGAHRDGVNFVAVILIARHQVKGGETRVFELEGHRGVRFTLTQPFSVLLMDDTRVIHESTPITPLDDEHHGWRDTLVLTYRADGFLEP